MWDNIQSLISLANIIQWISIIMIFIGGLLQVGKYFVDNRIGDLKDIEIVQKDSIRKQKEEELNLQVDSLKLNLVESTEEISNLKKKTKYVDPYTQPIQSGSSTVFVKIETNEEFNTNFMDQGGYLAFGKENEELLSLNNSQCNAKTIGQGITIFQGVFNLSATHNNIGKSLTFLKEAQYIQIQFIPMKENYKIIEGRAVCTFNGNARIEFIIPSQKMENHLIFIRELKTVFNETFK